MAEEEVDKLKLFWEHFFKAETGTYEKTTWLDLFLAEFLIRVNEGADPKELINFCPISGVVSLVGCELLCGIHRVTSAINTHYSVPLPTLDPSPPPDQEPEEKRDREPSGLFSRANAQSSTEILRKYLLSGVAWRCLLLLRALGVEGLSCCRQLSSVLIWLCGELEGGGAGSGESTCNPYVPTSSRARSVHQLFSSRIWSKQRTNASQGAKVTSLPPTENSSHTPSRSKRVSQIKVDSASSSPRRKTEQELQSSDSGGSEADLQLLNRSVSIQLRQRDDSFQYYDSPIRAPHSRDSFCPPSFSPRKTKPKADDYTTEQHKHIINSEISSYEFTIIITDLLQELCKADSSLSGSEGSQISVQCINFSLRNLCSLQFGSLPACSLKYSAREVSSIKLALTELLIVSLDKVLIRSDLCAKLISNGILPILLRILEDIIYKSNSKFHNKDVPSIDVDSDAEQSENLLKFVFGISYSIAAFFHCLLMQCRSVEKLREFTDQFKLYEECLKGASLRECVELMVRIPGSEELVKRLLEAIGKLVWAMKRVRSEVLHSGACPRSRHKACRARVAQGMHHHHDVLGASSGSGPALSSSCCVSLLYATLCDLLTDEALSAHSPLTNKLLRVMLNCGVCCCFSPGLLMENIVRLMLTHSNASSLCLQVLEHTVYGELGASVLVPKVTEQLPCSVCEPYETRNQGDPSRKYLPQSVSNLDRKSVWSFLIHYNSLLQLDNHNDVLHATVGHLQRVTPKCRAEMKYELLFSVIYPTFIVAKHRYIIRLEESAYFLTVSCLNIFSSLLNSVPFAEQFILKGGLSYVLELVNFREFAKQCCSILEIAIVVEIFKLVNETGDMTHFRDVNSLTSVQILMKSLAECTDKCYKIFRLKYTAEKFEELCDISKERELLSLPSRRDSDQTSSRKVSAAKPIKISYATRENSFEDSVEDYIEVLKNALTFWRCCAGLSLYSPQFRRVAAAAPALADSYRVARLALAGLAAAGAAPELAVLVHLLEATLTLQMALCDVTGGRSKEATCQLLRSYLIEGSFLMSEGKEGGEGGEALRALCDALIRVATRAASDTHTMPPASQAKMAPLAVAEGPPQSALGSSVESVSGPFARERADSADGYEADIELCKMEAFSKSRRASATSSPVRQPTPSTETSAAAQDEAGCPEYRAAGAVVHPELCAIVVELLMQLIQSALTKETSVSPHVWSTARGCVTRLSAACTTPLPLLTPLLRGAKDLLSTDKPELEELQRCVLELFQAAARGGIAAAEAGAVLRLAAARGAPTRLLLRALLRLLRHPPAPALELAFLGHLADTTTTSTSTKTTGQNHQAELIAKKLEESHTKAGIMSGWSAGAVRCGVDGAGWAAWLRAFSLLVWLSAPPAAAAAAARQSRDEWSSDRSESESPRVRPTTKKETKLETSKDLEHVISVGHESLMFEVWLDVATYSLVFRLSRPEPLNNRVLSEGVVEACLPPGKCCCLALQLGEKLVKRVTHIEVTVYVDGLEIETVSLPVQGILVRKAAPAHVVLGAAQAQLRVAGACVHRAPALRRHEAVRRAALPPHAHAAPAQVDALIPNYASILTPDLINSNIDWEQVFETQEPANNLLLSFSASNPDVYILYPPNASNAPAGGGGAGAGVALPARWRAARRRVARASLARSLRALHAPALLLCLVDKVREKHGSGKEEAMAVSVLLRACHVEPSLHSAFYSRPLPAFSPTVYCLQAVVSAACSAEVLSLRGDAVTLHCRSQAAILQPELLVHHSKLHLTECSWVEEDGGTLSWQRGSLWRLWLRVIAVLLQHRPRAAFNRTQLLRVGALTTLLTQAKERFLISEGGGDSVAEAAAGVAAASALLPAPPPAHHAALLADTLLLLHQASDTFVSHSRADFYFLVTPEAPEAGEFSLKRLMTKMKPSRRARKEELDDYDALDMDTMPSEMQMSMTSSVTSDDVSNDSLSALKEAGPGHDVPDSTKEMKGIINMQIKEQRKHVSSTSLSENSDVAFEESIDTTEDIALKSPAEAKAEAEAEAEASAAAAAAVEGEYVVVEVQDVGGNNYDPIYKEKLVGSATEAAQAFSEGLARLLQRAVETMMPEQASCAVEQDVLIVVASARAAGVRAACVRALAALWAAPREPARSLRAVALANQISLHASSRELVEACAALAARVDRPLEEQVKEESWQHVTGDSLSLSPPLLALLPASLPQPELVAALTAMYRHIVQKASLKIISDLALVEVCVKSTNVLDSLAATMDPEAYEEILQMICDVLAKVAEKALLDHHGLQAAHDIHHLLAYSPTASSEALQCRLYCAQLAVLQRLLAAPAAAAAGHPSTIDYFTTVLSSVSLHGEGLSRGEAAARLRSTLARALAFLALSDAPRPSRDQLALAARLTDALLHGLSRGGGWGAWGWAAGPEAGALLQELCLWALAPRPGRAPLQARLLTQLYHKQHLLPHWQNTRDLHQLSVLLLTSVARAHSLQSLELAITDWARGWALSLGGPERPGAPQLGAAAARAHRQLHRRRLAAREALNNHIHKAVFRWEPVCRAVAERAMAATRRAVELQNCERKAFLQQLRAAAAAAAAATRDQEKDTAIFTAERGVLHEPARAPRSWALDPTEGPGRVRVRLRRARLRIHPRFFKPQYQYKAELEVEKQRCQSPSHTGRGSSGVTSRLQLGERVLHMSHCLQLQLSTETPGELLLTDRAIHFIPEEAVPQDAGAGPEPEPGSVAGRRRGLPALEPAPPATWPLDIIKVVASRRWCLREVAIELFLSTGHAVLLAFPQRSARDALLQALPAPPALRNEAECLSEATNLWRNGLISNWEYLMRLNDLAGRSYNDLMQYPVMPYVIADYTSKILDLRETDTFRDLSRPMAVQNKAREQHYINTYNDLAAAGAAAAAGGAAHAQPHHYASLYSNSGAVLHYLVRLPPYTQLFLNYQDNNFDMPDRTFHSLATTWRLITRDSPTDVKEMLPELFYLPELLCNNEGLNLGVRQCGAAVDGVELPPWAADARHFTLLHRQALEAPAVSAALPHWIDLVFGYKQTGPAAKQAINVFPACTYYGFDPSALADAVERTAAEAMVRTYGQAPRRLFPRAHPARAPPLDPAPPDPPAQPEICSSVRGAAWGRYCGSPALGEPRVALRRRQAGARRLQPAPAPRAAAAAPARAVLLCVGGGAAEWAAAVAWWGAADGALRLRTRGAGAELLLHAHDQDDRITCCASSSCHAEVPLLVGTAGGRVRALLRRAGGAGGGAGGRLFRAHSRPLLAHSAPIVDIYVCVPMAVVVTASEDGLIVLWDLNELTYIRTLPNRDMLPVSHVTISDTLCDVASVHDLSRAPPSHPGHAGHAGHSSHAGLSSHSSHDEHHDHQADSYEKDSERYSSLIRVHTVNASFVASVKVVETVTCVCYSNAPEGISVNCVVAGLSTGGVRLYSSWDLRPVNYIPTAGTGPLLSVCYSSCGAVLWGAYAEGLCAAWEAGPPAPAPRLLPPPDH